ncbi:uncharacterized protein LOC111393374 isoform X2 [Olea europaea var. sylvestris]|uniref:uncharacterized protein LOC111393374 isoform X2 n=1 Tax=Olea europaea var. sylvestris TaxID=158386 RepID=UPI000C1D0A21|nr:uncharacterized protein LOC111393374 isoform X2 [Olea europaea var. sylvestris]
MSTIIPRYSRFLRIFSPRNSPNTLLCLLTQLRCTSNCCRTATVRTFLRPFSFTGHCLANDRGKFSVRLSAMSNAGGDGHQLLQFQLSPSNLLKIQKGDITQWSVDGSSDAIVNPANERMLGGGGADGAIHRAAGPELRAACYEVPEVRPGVRCPTGEARITPGFRLPASHVIHTVGPIYKEDENPEASLKNAYRNSLVVAKENNIHYVAFPAISCGVYGYPYDEAASVAISAVKEFANDLKEVHFVLFSDEIYDVWSKKAKELLQNS